MKFHMKSGTMFAWGFILLMGTIIARTDANNAYDDYDLLLLTVATNKTDGFQRYLRSASIFNLKGKALGMGEKWLGGDMNFPGGGFKINLLKKEMEEHKDKEKLIILFSDSYDVIVTGNKQDILSRYFEDLGGNIIFGAEPFCWPDSSLESQYPEVSEGKRFLNSGGFIGPAKDIHEMLNSKEVGNTDDDQLFYTQIYLNEDLRSKWNIGLDNRNKLFQNLNGAVGDVEMRFNKKGEAYLQNVAYDTKPVIIHGNGPSKRLLNHLGNYLPSAWNKEDHCTSCWEDTLSFPDLKETPQVVLGVFIEQPTPFIEEFFQLLSKLDYPKSKIDLYLHNADKYHDKDVNDFVQNMQNENNVDKFNSVTVVGPEENLEEWEARNSGLQKCSEVKCDYYFSVDSDSHLDNPHALKLLIEQNRGVLAPLLVRPYKAWSNFWGALTSEGFYARSTDYMEIVQNNRRGLWNVPFISSCYLIQGKLIHNPDTRPTFQDEILDADMAFCKSLRDNDIFFYISNRIDWGHLINADDFKIGNIHNELWEIMNNQYDWERRYLHPNYSSSLEEDAEVQQPCPDVFWFPIVAERFADELVDEMEKFGKWSDGSNNDPRLDGGYENVPTRDIHMNQIGFEVEWLKFLDRYVRPLQENVFDGYIHADARIEGGYEAVPTRDIHMKQIGMEQQWLEFLRLYVKPLVENEFIGYQSDPPRAIMNFVVRYRPDEQPLLRPHHDSSTYTINIALNNAGVDYTGGGCRFLRYDCSVPDTKKGWMLMHPGRLTHYHEGLETTSGTRYIMISFIDP